MFVKRTLFHSFVTVSTLVHAASAGAPAGVFNNVNTTLPDASSSSLSLLSAAGDSFTVPAATLGLGLSLSEEISTASGSTVPSAATQPTTTSASPDVTALSACNGGDAMLCSVSSSVSSSPPSSTAAASSQSSSAVLDAVTPSSSAMTSPQPLIPTPSSPAMTRPQPLTPTPNQALWTQLSSGGSTAGATPASSISSTVDQSTSSTVDQSTSSTANQSTSSTVDQSTSSTANQSTSSTVNQSTSSAVDQSTSSSPTSTSPSPSFSSGSTSSQTSSPSSLEPSSTGSATSSSSSYQPFPTPSSLSPVSSSVTTSSSTDVAISSTSLLISTATPTADTMSIATPAFLPMSSFPTPARLANTQTNSSDSQTASSDTRPLAASTGSSSFSGWQTSAAATLITPSFAALMMSTPSGLTVSTPDSVSQSSNSATTTGTATPSIPTTPGVTKGGRYPPSSTPVLSSPLETGNLTGTLPSGSTVYYPESFTSPSASLVSGQSNNLIVSSNGSISNDINFPTPIGAIMIPSGLSSLLSSASTTGSFPSGGTVYYPESFTSPSASFASGQSNNLIVSSNGSISNDINFPTPIGAIMIPSDLSSLLSSASTTGSLTETSSSTTVSLPTPDSATISDCGGSPYKQFPYTCYNGSLLCEVGLEACNGACFHPSQYACKNGLLLPSSVSATFSASSTSEPSSSILSSTAVSTSFSTALLPTSSTESTATSQPTSIPATTSPAQSDQSNNSGPPLSNGKVVGIAVASSSAALIAAVAGLFLLRRYSQMKRDPKLPSVYPEIAYLYDPHMPPRPGMTAGNTPGPVLKSLNRPKSYPAPRGIALTRSINRDTNLTVNSRRAYERKSLMHGNTPTLPTSTVPFPPPIASPSMVQMSLFPPLSRSPTPRQQQDTQHQLYQNYYQPQPLFTNKPFEPNHHRDSPPTYNMVTHDYAFADRTTPEGAALWDEIGMYAESRASSVFRNSYDGHGRLSVRNGAASPDSETGSPRNSELEFADPRLVGQHF